MPAKKFLTFSISSSVKAFPCFSTTIALPPEIDS